MNKVIFSGRITHEPQVKQTASGIPTIRFTLAVDRQIKDNNGNKVTDFPTCVAYGQPADFISKYVHKGNMLLVEGRLQTGKYTNQQGVEVYTTDTYVERVENLTPKSESAAATPTQPVQQPQVQPQQPITQAPQAFNVLDDENLPF